MVKYIRISQITLTAALMLGPVSAVAAAAQRPVTFGVVFDGPAPGNEELRIALQGEVAAALGADYRAQFPLELEIVADWTRTGISTALGQLLSDRSVDIVVALGIIGSQVSAELAVRPRPVVAPLVFDPALQALPQRNGTSGLANYTYAAFPRPGPVSRDLEWFSQLADLGHVTIVIDQAYLDAIPELQTAIEQEVAAAGYGHAVVGLQDRPDGALGATPPQSALYLGPLPRLGRQELERLADLAIRSGVPSFASGGEDHVQLGMMASALPPGSSRRIGRHAASQIQRILAGEDPADIPVLFSRDEQLTVNRLTASRLGVSPSWTALTELREIGPQLPGADEITLASAVRAAVARSPELSSRELQVEAGAAETRRARSALLPQVALAVDGRLIDSERATSNVGREPERMISGSVGLSQVLFSDRLWSDYTIEQRRQDARVQLRDQARLDLVLESSTAYLELLRSIELERLSQGDLAASRRNLELARMRQQSGMASPGEVTRWQAEVARSRQLAIGSTSRRLQAELAVNRVTRQPLEQQLRPGEQGPDEVAVLTNSPRLIPYLANPSAFKVFRDFMAQEALLGSPELRLLDAVAAARARELRAAKRAWFAPEVRLFADLGDVFTESGVGTTSPAFVETVPQAQGWQLGVSLSYPLFRGLSRPAAQSKARVELADARTRRDGVADKVEQRLRSAMHAMGASHAQRDLTDQQARAAEGNLRLVTESYRSGELGVTSLVEAQRAAFEAQVARANASYDFLVDLMEVERAVGSFSFFLTRAERGELLDRLDRFAASQRR